MKALEILKIKGIPVRIHNSWFFILILFTIISKGQISNYYQYNISDFVGYISGFLVSFLLFVSVIFHELGHCYIASQEGLKVKNVTLFFLGGVTHLE